MRILILGHSTSAGEGLPGREYAWPWLNAAAFERETGEAVDVVHVNFVALGSRAVPFALGKVDEAAPDLVIFSMGSYLCAIETVGERVRKRFGARLHGWFRKAEHSLDTRTRTGGPAARRTNRIGRTIARRLIGTAGYTSVESICEVYEDLLHALARREGIHTLVFCEPGWPAQTVKENPRAQEKLEAIQRHIRPIVDRHHFLWADAEDTYSRVPDRSVYYFPDGVHKTVRGHEAQAAALLPVLLAHREALVGEEAAAPGV